MKLTPALTSPLLLSSILILVNQLRQRQKRRSCRNTGFLSLVSLCSSYPSWGLISRKEAEEQEQDGNSSHCWLELLSLSKALGQITLRYSVLKTIMHWYHATQTLPTVYAPLQPSQTFESTLAHIYPRPSWSVVAEAGELEPMEACWRPPTAQPGQPSQA